MAHQHYRTKGIVLLKKDSGEADQIFVLYTQDFGKIEVVGKAIRKITSKLKAGIDVFYFIEIEFIQGKNKKILTDTIVIDKFLALRKNSEIISCAGLVAEVVDSLTHKEKREDEIWQLLTAVFQKLNDQKTLTTNYKLLFYYFLWNFFSLLGYSPELYICSVCAKKLLPETFFLSPHHGGIVCWGCCDEIKKENQQILFNEISVNAVKLIRFLIKQPMEMAQRLNPCQNDLRDLTKAGDAYFDFLVKS